MKVSVQFPSVINDDTAAIVIGKVAQTSVCGFSLLSARADGNPQTEVCATETSAPEAVRL